MLVEWVYMAEHTAVWYQFCLKLRHFSEIVDIGITFYNVLKFNEI